MLKQFTLCEVTQDIPPIPFDKAVPVDRNFSSPYLPTPSPSPFLRQSRASTSKFVGTILNNPSPTHKKAIDYCMKLAGTHWTSNIPVSVRVNFSNLGNSLILGQGQPTRNWVVNDYICPVALAEAVVEEELNAMYSGIGKFDVLITLNTATSWYTGLDARPPSRYYDLVTVCLHEIYHGLFMSGGNIAVSLSPNTLAYAAFFVTSSVTGRFDSFMANQDGCNITAYKKDPSSLGTVLTGNNLWFVTESERVAKLYAPKPYIAGSSLYHLSETDYGGWDGENNDLMTPAIGSNYAQHNIGPIMSRIQALVLDIEGKVGADRCEVVNPPEVDNTPIDQDTGNSTGPREVDGSGLGGFVVKIGDTVVNGWVFVGAAGGLVALVVVSVVVRCVLSGRKKKERPRRRVQQPMRFGNAGGVV